VSKRARAKRAKPKPLDEVELPVWLRPSQEEILAAKLKVLASKRKAGRVPTMIVPKGKTRGRTP
jgi:hypothetical protein